MQRRTFLGVAAGVIAKEAPAQVLAIPMIDTHIHLYDPSRPQGIPWPEPDSPIYRRVLPADFRKVAQTLGVRGAIEIECSPWLDDNQWVLDVIGEDTFMLGTIGNLEPDKPEFPQQLERFQRNPLFLGIRYGNLWDRDFTAAAGNPTFVAGVKLLAEAGLTFDTANPDVRLLEDVIRLTDQVPNLRVVIDHLASLDSPAPAAMRELAKRPQVYVKVSQVLHPGHTSPNLEAHRAKLDELWETFGEDRLLYGSDWPNSEPQGSYQQVLGVVREYFTGKGRAAAEKYFWRNSTHAYQWKTREPGQPPGFGNQGGIAG